MVVFVRSLIGIVFVLSSVGKIAGFIEFTLFVGSFIKLSDLVVIFISSLLVGIELLIGSFFIVNFNVKETSIIGIFLMVLLFLPFTIYFLIAGETFDCGCFGVIDFLNSENHYLNFFKNLIILSGLLWLFKSYSDTRIKIKTLIFYILLFTFPIYFYNSYHLHGNLVLVKNIEIKNFLAEPDAYIIVDARDESIYLEKHIPNAISVPYTGDSTDLSRLRALMIKEKNKKILTYCDVASCSLAKLLALRISSQFRIETYELKGGIEQWENSTNL